MCESCYMHQRVIHYHSQELGDLLFDEIKNSLVFNENRVVVGWRKSMMLPEQEYFNEICTTE